MKLRAPARPLARLAAAIAMLGTAGFSFAEPVTLNIASINNPDMIELQKLSPQFEKANPDIKLRWVTMEESVLRQRLTTDIATNSGQFDLMTIGAYEAPIWAKKGWLAPMTGLPADYDEADLIKTVREGLTSDGKLYALPFYAESSMTYYRKDLFAQKNLKMPEKPTWEEIGKLAAQLHDPAKGVYGICLRGRAGWARTWPSSPPWPMPGVAAGSTSNGSRSCPRRNGRNRSTSMST